MRAILGVSRQTSHGSKSIAHTVNLRRVTTVLVGRSLARIAAQGYQPFVGVGHPDRRFAERALPLSRRVDVSHGVVMGLIPSSPLVVAAGSVASGGGGEEGPAARGLTSCRRLSRSFDSFPCAPSRMSRRLPRSLLGVLGIPVACALESDRHRLHCFSQQG